MDNVTGRISEQLAEGRSRQRDAVLMEGEEMTIVENKTKPNWGLYHSLQKRSLYRLITYSSTHRFDLYLAMLKLVHRLDENRAIPSFTLCSNYKQKGLGKY